MLQEVERGGVAGFRIAVKVLVGAPNGAGTLLPENLQNVELGFGGWRCGHVDDSSIRRISYSVQESYPAVARINRSRMPSHSGPSGSGSIAIQSKFSRSRSCSVLY